MLHGSACPCMLSAAAAVRVPASQVLPPAAAVAWRRTRRVGPVDADSAPGGRAAREPGAHAAGGRAAGPGH
eukprot:265905-Chlamydomonas_euryale.AAC.1